MRDIELKESAAGGNQLPVIRCQIRFAEGTRAKANRFGRYLQIRTEQGPQAGMSIHVGHPVNFEMKARRPVALVLRKNFFEGVSRWLLRPNMCMPDMQAAWVQFDGHLSSSAWN